MQRIFVVAAHPDDEVLGLGGTIRRLVDEGNEVSCLILGEGATSRGENRIDTDKRLLEELHLSSEEASCILGYNNLYFANLPDNRFDSVDLLDLVKIIEKYIKIINPDTIYTHHRGDLNIDHQRTFEAVLTACRPDGTNFVREILCFETPSSTEWNFDYNKAFCPNVFVEINKTLNSKLKAMSCYKSEAREYPHPRSLKSLEIIAARWGTVVGTQYAEAFELVRKIILK